MTVEPGIAEHSDEVQPKPAANLGFPLAMQWTGSGSEYFRIWIVNLLLTLVTVGLYYPFAKVRRLRYFYGNTTLGGQAFDFHGSPWKMLRGFILMAVLLGAYAMAGNFGAVAGLIALALVAALWPALFRASMQFRLGNTSWRGLRFHFSGDTPGAYKAMLPVMIPALMYLGAIQFLTQEEGAKAAPNTAALIVMGSGALLIMVLMPLFWWSIKRYQHGHLALGRVGSEFRGSVGAFYVVFLKALGLVLLMLVPLIAIGAAAAFFGLVGRGSKGMAIALLPLVFLVFYLLLLTLVGGFLASRLQNLIWQRTKSAHLRFESQLRARSMAALMLKNWLLIVLTLGLYLPWANVAKAKMQLEAITVFTRHPPDEMVARLERSGGDAAGDAAADLLGFDIGL